MRIVALLAVYNEERFLPRALRHLAEQGVESYIIDNESEDATARIARDLVGRGVLGVETFPRGGVYRWTDLLRRKEQLHTELGADWYMHYDADEIRQAPNPWKTLAQGLAAVDAAGFNAVNFDQFVFMPTTREENFDHDRFVEEMRHYYYYNPKPLDQVKAWKNFGQRVDLVSTLGHQAVFEGRRVFPQAFIMRHYQALSFEQVVRKYCRRVYSDAELSQGFHGSRARMLPQDVRFPDRRLLKQVSDDNTWDTSDPWTSNEEYLFGGTGLRRAPRTDAPWRVRLQRRAARLAQAAGLRPLLLRLPFFWRLVK